MNRQDGDRMDRLEARCLRLERSVHRWRNGGIVLMGMLLLAVVFGFRAMEKPEPLKVASMTVRDDEDSTMVWIGQEFGYGRIKLYDTNGELFWTTPHGGVEPQEKTELPQEVIDKISKMTVEEAQARLAKVAEARKNGSGDAEMQQLLKAEFTLLIYRIGEARREK